MLSLKCQPSGRGDLVDFRGPTSMRMRGLLMIWLLLATGLTACVRDHETRSSTAIVRKLTSTVEPLELTSTAEPTRITPIPMPIRNTQAVCSQRRGTLEQAAYISPILRQEVPYLIYLPPCYEDTRAHFPSLYLLHGFPFDESQWIDLDIVGRVNDGIEGGRWPSILMIMPRLPEPLFTSTDGGSGSYEAEMVTGLIPEVERRYRTDPRASRRALVGISRGAVWALEIGLRNAELFDAVAAMSPALHVNYARPPYDPYLLVESGQSLPARFFLSAGEAEPSFLEAVLRFAAVLEEQEIPHELVISSAGHDAAGWMIVLDDMLSYLLDPWNP